KDFYEFMDTDLGEQGGDVEGASKEDSLAIEFKNVTFAYPGTDKNVLKDFSLSIPKGQKLAIVGINGAGKTTFVKLLTGLFKVNEGEILINGININEYKKSELYRMFGAVFQEVNILALTIAENIACTMDGIDYKKVDKVLKQVGLYHKVYELKDNVKTNMLKIIDENGVVFSGGESQKLAIARALYKGGNCVIMDEPTAALDALAEAEIYNKFDLLTQVKTAIYISHRLASTKFCDAIALLDDTGLREYGTHEELMDSKGAYYDMFVTQGKYYQEGGELA
ncbi:MAG: ABC transporter ATP-binding protein, partial [Clostridium sp.]